MTTLFWAQSVKFELWTLNFEQLDSEQYCVDVVCVFVPALSCSHRIRKSPLLWCFAAKEVACWSCSGCCRCWL